MNPNTSTCDLSDEYLTPSAPPALRALVQEVAALASGRATNGPLSVRIMIGAACAYAAIEHGSRKMDVALQGGRGVPADLREQAAEILLRAVRMVHAAQLYLRAADEFERRGRLN